MSDLKKLRRSIRTSIWLAHGYPGNRYNIFVENVLATHIALLREDFTHLLSHCYYSDICGYAWYFDHRGAVGYDIRLNLYGQIHIFNSWGSVAKYQGMANQVDYSTIADTFNQLVGNSSGVANRAT